uniref:Vitellogenin domain-containing protein n=1 Tax=Glossina austeni TaxID=7395 RepID=A0A1A9VCY5_GLOAU
MYKFFIYLLLAGGLRLNGLWANKSWLHIDNSYDVFLNRQKRYLLFEKSAAVTFQGFVGKAIVSETPRGLNQIVEYTLMYELPTEIQLSKTKKAFNTAPTIAATSTTESYPIIIPYHPSFNKHKKYSYYYGSRRNWSPNRMKNTKCFKRNLYEYVNDSIGRNVCQERIKKRKRLQRQLKFDNAGQRMLYDILEQWSLM